MEYNGIENVYLNGTMMGFTDREIAEKLPEILEDCFLPSPSASFTRSLALSYSL